jgi:hypothetical protein
MPVRPRPAAGDLANGGSYSIRNIQLKNVAADQLFDAAGHVRTAWIESRHAGRSFRDDVHGASHADPAADAEQERVITIDEFRRQ